MSTNELVETYVKQYAEQFNTYGITGDTLARVVVEDITLLQMVSIVVRNAAETAVDRALSGDHHDGGARKMVSELATWALGLQGDMIRGYDWVVSEANKVNDPVAFAEYERLKAKFEK